MFFKLSVRKLLVALSLCAVCSFSHAKEAFLILDILPLKEGKTLEDANEYFENVEPIFERYKFTRAQAPLKVLSIPRGSIEAQVVNLWETPDPDHAFKGIFSDQEYLKFVKDRDAIFQLEKATVIVTQQ